MPDAFYRMHITRDRCIAQCNANRTYCGAWMHLLKIETDLHLLPKRIDVSLDEDNDKEVLGKNGEDHVYDQDDDDANWCNSTTVYMCSMFIYVNWLTKSATLYTRMYFNFTPQVVCRSFLCVPVNSSKPACSAKVAHLPVQTKNNRSIPPGERNWKLIYYRLGVRYIIHCGYT